MKCITCTDQQMNVAQLPHGPRATECTVCNGHWITNFDYWRWHGQLDRDLPEKEPDADIEADFNEPAGARCCPDCNVLISKYRVGHGTHFFIERCGTCGGMWFDGNEWNALQSRNLHDEIHKVFGAPWQAAVRAAQKSSVVEKRMRDLLGDDKYIEVEQLRSWLKHDKDRSVILQFLGSNT